MHYFWPRPSGTRAFLWKAARRFIRVFKWYIGYASNVAAKIADNTIATPTRRRRTTPCPGYRKQYRPRPAEGPVGWGIHGLAAMAAGAKRRGHYRPRRPA